MVFLSKVTSLTNQSALFKRSIATILYFPKLLMHIAMFCNRDNTEKDVGNGSFSYTNQVAVETNLIVVIDCDSRYCS